MVRSLEGNPGRRPLNDREPRASDGVPDCPDYLDGEAKAEWFRTAAVLREMGLLTKADRTALAAYGVAYASMNAPTKKLEELVIGGKLAHAGHPVLRWMAGNVAVEKDAADNWKPSKKKSRERIDGIVALVMAIDRATTQPAEPQCWFVPGNLAL